MGMARSGLSAMPKECCFLDHAAPGRMGAPACDGGGGRHPGEGDRREAVVGVAPGGGVRGRDAALGRPEALVEVARGDERDRRWEAVLPWHEMCERQEERLKQQVQELGLPTDWQPPADADVVPGGAEHVLWRGRDGRVYKMTKEDHFGQVPCSNPESITGWENFAAAPADYLERLALVNRVFGDDLRVEGLRCGRTVAIVISQPLARAARTRTPHPRGLQKIEAYMEARGFVNLGFAAWYHPQEKLMVTDATRENFVQTRRGLVPVDLMICRAEGELLRALEAKVASGQANDEVRWKSMVNGH